MSRLKLRVNQMLELGFLSGIDPGPSVAQRTPFVHQLLEAAALTELVPKTARKRVGLLPFASGKIEIVVIPPPYQSRPREGNALQKSMASAVTKRHNVVTRQFRLGDEHETPSCASS